MNGFTKILLLAGAGLAAWYVPTLIAIYNMNFEIISVIPTEINESRIKALVGVKLQNNSNTNVQLQYIKSEILLNGLKIAEFSQPETLVILGNSQQNFNIEFSVDAQLIGTELLRELLAQNLQNSVLNIRGTLTGNNKKIPFNMYRTLNDFKV